jgi:hypothetical protein
MLPVAVLPVEELASLRRLRDRVESESLVTWCSGYGDGHDTSLPPEECQVCQSNRRIIDAYRAGTPDLDETVTLSGSRLTSALRRQSSELSVALVQLREPDGAPEGAVPLDEVVEPAAPAPEKKPRKAKSGTPPGRAPRECSKCRAPYVPTGNRQEFCSTSCRDAAAEDRRRAALAMGGEA